MSKVIEVYVKSQEMPVQFDFSSFSTDHASYRGWAYKEESARKLTKIKGFFRRNAKKNF